ncbi:unnamed protein product [Larinioides sclopetarius]|uniref:Uncharacterized protein n=1 Tax=Larinioides sclopetarius TaxID=280406 RepID=A0AAV1ZXP5_9ARAC
MALRLFFIQRATFSKLCTDELLNKSLSAHKINSPSLLWMSTKREATHRPNTLEKYLLVWMKKYPSVAEVPKYVTWTELQDIRFSTLFSGSYF